MIGNHGAMTGKHGQDARATAGETPALRPHLHSCVAYSLGAYALPRLSPRQAGDKLAGLVFERYGLPGLGMTQSPASGGGQAARKYRRQVRARRAPFR